MTAPSANARAGFLIALLAALFSFGLIRVFDIRFSTGDVYPEYSSLRSSPEGAKLLYDSLSRTPGIVVTRNYLPLEYLEESDATIFLFALDAEQFAADPDPYLDIVERLAKRGNRIVAPLRWESSRKPLRTGELDRRWHVKFGFDAGEKHEHHLYFSEAPGWRVLDRDGPKLLAIERSFEKGSVVLFAESRGFNNESVVKLDRLALVAAAIGPGARGADARGASAGALGPGTRGANTSGTNTGDPNTRGANSRGPGAGADTGGPNPRDPNASGPITRGADTRGPNTRGPNTGGPNTGGPNARGPNTGDPNSGSPNTRAPNTPSPNSGSPNTPSPNTRVVFDEQHFGIAESGSVVGLARRFRLTGMAAGLALCAALFIWKNASGFPPPAAAERSETLAGRTSISGLFTLLRRHVKPADLAAACWNEWLAGNRASVSPERMARAHAILRDRAGQPLDAVREIQNVLHSKGPL